jgi:hypothetical protein
VLLVAEHELPVLDGDVHREAERRREILQLGTDVVRQ